MYLKNSCVWARLVKDVTEENLWNFLIIKARILAHFCCNKFADLDLDLKTVETLGPGLHRARSMLNLLKFYFKPRILSACGDGGGGFFYFLQFRLFSS